MGMGGIAQYSPKGFDPLDVARDFLGPIMFSINNDPLWQSAMLVGMVGATVYQIRVLNRITATQIGDRSLKAVTVVSTSRLLSLGTQETKQDPLAISAKDDTFPENGKLQLENIASMMPPRAAFNIASMMPRRAAFTPETCGLFVLIVIVKVLERLYLHHL